MTVPQPIPVAAVPEEAPADLTSVFHRVNNVLPEDQALLCIPFDMPVAQALDLMERNNFSQIPIKAGNEILGVFSYRYFAQKVSAFTGEKIDLNQIQVGEFVDKVEFIDILDDLVKTLESLDKKDAILVGNRKELNGVLTPIDLVRYLYRLSSPFVLLGEIEKGVRNIIRDSSTPEKLQEMIQQTLSQVYQAEKMPKLLADMTFNDYVQVIGDGRTWKHFEVVFGSGDLQRKRTRVKLEQIRDLRNDTFHFKRELLEDDINTLVIHRDWIKNTLTAYQAKKAER
jgi:hypothetical protein